MEGLIDAVNLIAFIRRKLYLANCLFFVQFPELCTFTATHSLPPQTFPHLLGNRCRARQTLQEGMIRLHKGALAPTSEGEYASQAIDFP
jgi:hypothetical protein